MIEALPARGLRASRGGQRAAGDQRGEGRAVRPDWPAICRRFRWRSFSPLRRHVACHDKDRIIGRIVTLVKSIAFWRDSCAISCSQPITGMP